MDKRSIKIGQTIDQTIRKKNNAIKVFKHPNIFKIALK